MARGESLHGRSGRGLDRRAALAGGLAAMLGLALSACGRGERKAAEAPGRVTLRLTLDARPSALHGGLYQALSAGLYARRGLDIEVLDGVGAGAAGQRLAAGSAELAVGFDSQALLALRATGAPVRAVAAFFQKDVRALAVRGTEPLTDLAALAPRPFAVAEDDMAAFWPLLRARYDIAEDRLLSGDSQLELFQATPDAVLVADIGAGLEAGAEAAAQPLQWRLPADEGFAGYGGLIVAPDAFARDNAAALRAFIVASAEGWRDYLAAPATAAPGAQALIARAAPGATLAGLEAQRARLVQSQAVLGGDAPVYGIGAMTGDRWAAYVEAAVAAGVLPQGVEAANAFTVGYLPGRG